MASKIWFLFLGRPSSMSSASSASQVPYRPWLRVDKAQLLFVRDPFRRRMVWYKTASKKDVFFDTVPVEVFR
jgi:hypothetical protein